MKEIVVSGIRPTGKLHLGNYFGAFKHFLTLQEQYDSYFFIADYHSLTTHPNPADLKGSVQRVLAEYIALGLDPEKCTIYLQSDLPETAELYLFLNMNDIMDADYVITMANDVHDQVLRFCRTEEQRQKIHKFRKFDPEAPNTNVPDPWYNDRFEDVFQIVDRNCGLWLQEELLS